MLKQLRSRKATKRIMFWTLVLTIPSFVFFYGWQSSKARQNVARGSIGWVKDRWFGLRKRPITPIEHYLARSELQSRYLNYFRNMGFRVRPEQLGDLVQTADVAHEAVDDFYLREFARKKGLEVTNRELRSVLSRYLAGVTAEQVRASLQAEGKTEQEFLLEQRDRLTLGKARQLIASRAKVSLFELWQEYLISAEKILVDYVKIPCVDFEDKVDVTTASLQQYYQDHAENYRVGDRLAFRYVAILRSDIEKQIHPTTDTVKAYYEAHKEAFKRPRSVRVRHIFLSAGRDEPTTKVEAARKKIEKIAAQLKAGADFAELANQYSQDTDNVDPNDPSRKHGGLLPMPISEKTPVAFGEEFKRVALSLNEGEVSSPVLGARGYHLIKCDSVTTAGIPPFEEVSDRARRICREELVDKAFRKKGEQLRELFNKSSYSTLESFAKAANLPTTTTELIEIDKNPFIPEIGSIRDELDLIKDLRPGEYYEAVIKSSNAYYVLGIERREPSHIPPLENIIEQVREDYVTSQSTTLARRVALDLFRKAREAGRTEDRSTSPDLIARKRLETLKKLAKAHGFEVKQSEPFTRLQPDRFLPDLDPKFARNTLRFKTGNVYLTTQGDPNGEIISFVVWYFEKREKPSREEFRKELPRVRKEYLSQVQQALIQEWLQDMRRRHRAGINKKLFEQSESEKGSG